MTDDRSDSIPLTDPIPTTGPLTGAENMALCKGCTRCCTYVAVEVDAPDMPWMYDQYVWMLDHRGVWMYVETGNHWYVQFETVCEQLEDSGRCGVHGRHPVLCKEYDARGCERRGDLAQIKARFRRGEDLLRWLEKQRPVHHKRYREWFEAAHAPKAVPAPGPAPAPVVMERYPMPEAPVSPLILRKVLPRVAALQKS
jgi:hypothetical protein